MKTSQYEETDLTLKNASLEKIAATASAVIYRNKQKKNLSIKDVSGNSGAKTFICMDDEVPKCIVKVKGDKSIMSSHPNTEKRVVLATEVLRKHNIAPSILMRGADFHIEKSVVFR